MQLKFTFITLLLLTFSLFLPDTVRSQSSKTWQNSELCRLPFASYIDTATQNLTLTFDDYFNKTLRVNVYDNMGNIVMRKVHTPNTKRYNSYTFTVEHLPPGSYRLEVKTAQMIGYKRIFKPI
ncbi:MAG: hypothetical protein AAF655_15970 [Bacteroidota bacterium]